MRRAISIPDSRRRTAPAATPHFAVSDALSDAMERVRKGGGEVVSDVIDIPVGSFFYAKDTEGNSLGLFKYRS